MNERAYYVIMILCLLFNVGMFALVWIELRSQRKWIHDLNDRWTKMFAGVTLVLVEHASELARLGSQPFRPAAVFEKMDADTRDPETQRVIADVARLLQRARL